MWRRAASAATLLSLLIVCRSGVGDKVAVRIGIIAPPPANAAFTADLYEIEIDQIAIEPEGFAAFAQWVRKLAAGDEFKFVNLHSVWPPRLFRYRVEP
ncbi:MULTISPECIES: hypothetical protein [unclassified Bradyrhizobium]